MYIRCQLNGGKSIKLEPDSMVVMRTVVKVISCNLFSDHGTHGTAGDMTVKNILVGNWIFKGHIF